MNTSLSQKLTKREIEVLEKVAKGKDIKTIADELNISVKTVSVHIKKIHKKTGTKEFISTCNTCS